MSAATPNTALPPKRRSSLLARLMRDRVALVAALVLGLMVLAALLAPWVAPYDPYFTDLSKPMQPPDGEHWLGTDNTGRDMLSRVLYGTRNTLMMGLAGVLIGGALGALLVVLRRRQRMAASAFDPDTPDEDAPR